MSKVLKSKKILVIDDEQSMLDIVQGVLAHQGASPTGVSSFQRGLQALKSEAFDAVILDRYMPDGDGHEILRALKSNSRTKNIPVVMLTGEKNMEQVRLSLKMGAVGYIVKPFTPKSFLGQLEKILDNTVKLDVG